MLKQVLMKLLFLWNLLKQLVPSLNFGLTISFWK